MIEILVLLDVQGLEDKEVFEKHVQKEGFKIVPEEPFVYTGESTTQLFACKAYILEVFKIGLQKTDFESAHMVFLLNETPYPAYTYDKTTHAFELAEDKQ